MPNYKLKNRPVRIETSFGEDVLLLKSFSGTERLGRPFQYDLVLASEGHDLDYKKIIGQNVTVFVEKEGKEPRYFNGFVSRFAQTKYEQKLAEYHATVVPWLWFLTRSSDCRIFQNMKIPDILKQVFQDFGFSDIIDRLHGSYRQWSYCVQYRETAFAFVSRLMEEEGIYYYFKHEHGKHTIVLCDSPASHKEFAGYEELLYRPPAAHVVETLSSWVVEHEVETGAFAANNFDFTNPKANFLASSFRDRGHGQSQREQFDYLGEQSPFDEYYTSDHSSAPNENERYSKLYLEELQVRHETYSGEGDARGICTGVRFVLKGHPYKDFEKEYLTTGAEYLIECNPFETTEEAGDEFKYNAKMSAMLLEDQFRPPRVTPKPAVLGPQTAIVVGPSGQKIYTDPTGYGMVKVQFHWDRVGKNDENSSCWVRVSQAWAGKNWGDMALPHVGDEVIVECLEGDPDRPIITGRVYNATNMPPFKLPDNKDKRVWQDDYGNQLVFVATPGDEHIRLHSPHHNSGIIVGRSTEQWTGSNDLNTTFGDKLDFTGGAKADIIGGIENKTVIGAKTDFVVGTDLGAKLGSKYDFTYGCDFGFSGGYKYESHGSDVSKFCEGHMVFGANKVLNLVAGHGHDDGSSVFHAGQQHLELTVGKSLGNKELPHKTRRTVQAILGLTPLVFGILVMGVSGGLAKVYEDAGSDEKKCTDSRAGEDALLGVCGTLEAAGLAAMIAYDIYLWKKGGKKTHMSHYDPNTKQPNFSARLELKAGTKPAYDDSSASLEANKAVELFANKRNAHLNMDDTGIKLEHQGANVIIQAGTSSITINKSGTIEISGTKVNVTGLNVAKGALTVQDQPVAMASTLDLRVKQLKAADQAEALKRYQDRLELLALRVDLNELKNG